ncbi:MAG: hypothetical protein J7574_11290 [Flavobacterium sp.]|uniref:hypothetical protein n=1 Tax=Flavobacterium sp. TaxID=239 RepID=UPI001B232502|nr:hypothetical protein [Flavobacterium sp.]MBO9584732.1 hypothetical protein [Flavobacterium sp.]
MDEVLEILGVTDEFFDEDLIQALEKSEDDIKAGRVISFSDFKEKLKDKYNI